MGARRICILLLAVLWARAATTTHCVQHAGLQRCWLLQVPPTIISPPRLIVDIHGYTSSGADISSYSGFKQIALKQGMLVAWPDGTKNLPSREATPSWNAGLCCGASSQFQANIDDVGFLRKLVATVAAEHGVDAGRHVFWAGHSNGCAMAQRMGTQASDIVAAIGCHAMYLMYSGSAPQYSPVPIMEIHGTSDDTVAYSGFMLFYSALKNARDWAKRNGCNGASGSGEEAEVRRAC